MVTIFRLSRENDPRSCHHDAMSVCLDCGVIYTVVLFTVISYALLSDIQHISLLITLPIIGSLSPSSQLGRITVADIVKPGVFPILLLVLPSRPLPQHTAVSSLYYRRSL
ncbi:hypothetical protein BDN72DRAFT_844981 [Pluteus cervinus]|uniref:Uncharacterized protein n=1 Tax=Pluteus cervinus TaxID=181527 RepID=A0ACD3AJ44_9AGAR|nr:hypothetical protein BDN72DRAFT_844981 [Pluteus cervinus]